MSSRKGKTLLWRPLIYPNLALARQHAQITCAVVCTRNMLEHVARATCFSDVISDVINDVIGDVINDVIKNVIDDVIENVVKDVINHAI